MAERTQHYRSKPYLIKRADIRQRQITTEFFICPACKDEITDIEYDFNSIEDLITFECPSCGVDLQVEPPKPTEGDHDE